MASADNLPVEVITHIMRYLNVSDRKEVSVLNSNWYKASLDPALQRDAVINLHSLLTNFRAHLYAVGWLGCRRESNLILDHQELNDEGWWHVSSKYISPRLINLSVRGCDISEANFILFLSRCNNLVSLDLTGCNSLFMTGRLLESESDRNMLKPTLKNVKELTLTSVRYLSNETFNRLVYTMGSLEKINLSCCPILFHSSKSSYTDSTLFTFSNILTYLQSHQSLKSIGLSNTGITNDALKTMANIPGLNLDSIDLSYCRDVGNEGISELCRKQRGIRRLDMTGCPEIGDVVVDEVIGNLKEIRELMLKQCAFITDNSVKKLNTLPNLQVLNLAGVHRPSQIGLTTGLAQLANLVSLCLSGSPAVNDTVVLSLCLNLTSLRSLDLSSCISITDRSVHGICHHLRDLRHLNLAWCKEITDLGLLGLAGVEVQHEHVEGACKCARKFDQTQVFHIGIRLNDLPNITDQQIENLQSQSQLEPKTILCLKSLLSLNLQGVANISDSSITKAIGFTSLQCLNLNMCRRITDSSLVAIANKNPSIEELYLGSCNISDTGMMYLLPKLPRMRTLVISNCVGLSDSTVKVLGEACRRLVYLDVSFCSEITDCAMDSLEERLTNLQEVSKRFINTGD